MAIALQLGRSRRTVALCMASVLLHYLAAGWLDGQGEAPLPSVRAPSARIMAELLAPQRAVEVAPEKAPESAPAPPRKSAARRVLAETSAVVPARPVQSSQQLATTPRYRASPPPAAELTLDVARVDAQGAGWNGEAVLAWSRDDGRYRLRYRGGMAEMDSEGLVGGAGIIPRTMTEKRGNRARTATHFGAQGNITFSAAQDGVPMQSGAQDRATLPMQLAAIARADPGQLAAGVVILVGAEKDASVYRFVLQGQEEIDTGLGRLATWRIARVVPPGSYNARLDIWLAPGRDWYPVQLRSTEANGTVTTQTIRTIVVKDAGN